MVVLARAARQGSAIAREEKKNFFQFFLAPWLGRYHTAFSASAVDVPRVLSIVGGCPMLRLRFLAPLLVVGMMGTGFLMGDDKSEPIIVRPSLPNYYRLLGLTPKQKNEIYKVRAKYAAQIQELKQKISDLQDEEKTNCEKLLTAAQKDRLREILGNPNRKKIAEDDDPPVNVDKKKGSVAKDKNGPGELNKPVEKKK
jgi:hypothetical protein